MKAFIFLILALSFMDNGCGNSQGVLNPCRRQRPLVKKSGLFEIGLAFWTNVSYSQWGSTEDGLHPCSTADRDAWNSEDVLISYYNVEVDKLTLLGSVNNLQDSYLQNKDNVTMIAFSGGYRSKPRTIRIKDGDDWLYVHSLALIADFDAKGLKQLQWFDLECGDCQNQDQCLQFEDQQSCASVCQSSNQMDCRTEIYISFDGIDKKDQVLNSATQIRRLRSSSMSALYESTRNFASSAVN